MEGAYGKLCHRCKRIFSASVTETVDLYRNYREFLASKNNGCVICSLLWAAHKPPAHNKRGAENVDGDYEFGQFDIYTRGSCKTGGMKFGSVHSPEIGFHITTQWAEKSTMYLDIVNIDTQIEDYISFVKYFAETIELDLGLELENFIWGLVGRSPRTIEHKVETLPWRVLGPSTGSDESLIKIREWVSSCEANHKHCNLNRRHRVAPSLGASTFFPSRVVDVEKADIGIISLRDRAEVLAQFGSKNDEPPAYWTLSHRWGETNAMPRLLKETELRLREGIKLDELPPIDRMWPAFRDAALLVKRLGYRYLWIDSLCIFQDSETEWQREAGMMAKGGLTSRLLYPFIINGDDDKPWCLLWCRPSWNHEVEDAPLASRGWVVQERFLSTRTVYFTDHQIFWECLEATDSETQPRGGVLQQTMFLIDRENTKQDGKSMGLGFCRRRLEENTPKLHLHASNTQMSKEVYDDWDRVVNYYMSCGLTKESDRLIAISGIAKAFHEATGDTVSQGIPNPKSWACSVVELDITHESSGKALR
ncbi:uncharacterized protein F4812DRAFT_458304 [Daldinia caldariorum]|uniref:uncharacterized protein n=1 Tax=Daldinia caldariorum TaxID=326644 RepID=UPI002007C16A|nr:uncharacterized protein F4812DRAFT_458304 [Daldinia caldariorum]KAI1468776.1 hypothetical protein F4812DRAFT_458304 [Daldinia caldariorum]